MNTPRVFTAFVIAETHRLLRHCEQCLLFLMRKWRAPPGEQARGFSRRGIEPEREEGVLMPFNRFSVRALAGEKSDFVFAFAGGFLPCLAGEHAIAPPGSDS